MNPRRFVMLLSAGLLLSTCSNDQQQTPAADQEWIEVPLSEHTFRDSSELSRHGTYDIYVAAFNALEFKLDIKQGDTIVYDWAADTPTPEMLMAEFHGHTERVGDAPGTVMFYKIHQDGKESGSLTAPFDGIHGWYLKNSSASDIVVVLNVAGFYQEVE